MSFKNKLVLLCMGVFLSVQGGAREVLYEKNIDQVAQHNDEDKILEDVYRSSGRLYQKLVELAALYYCGGSKVLQDRIVMELGKDMVLIVKSLALYIPVLLKNPKVSKKTKLKKSVYVVGAMTVLGFLIKEFYEGYQGFGKNNMIGYGRSYPQGHDNYGGPLDCGGHNLYQNYQSPMEYRPQVPRYKNE